MNEHHLIGVEWIKKDKIAFILSTGSTIFVTFDPVTCDLIEIVTDKFLQSKFNCDQLINSKSDNYDNSFFKIFYLESFYCKIY